MSQNFGHSVHSSVSAPKKEACMGVSLLLAPLLPGRGRDIDAYAEICEFSYPFCWNPFLLLCWPGCFSFSAGLSSSHKGILVHIYFLFPRLRTILKCGFRAIIIRIVSEVHGVNENM